MRDTLPMPDVPTTVPNGVGSHTAALGALVASMVGYLPYLFAALPAIYYCILIYESKTVQGWVERRRARKLAKAKAAVIVAAAQGEAKTVVAQAEVAVAKDAMTAPKP